MKIYNKKYTLSSVRLHLLYITIKRRYFAYFFFLLISAVLYRFQIDSKKLTYHKFDGIELYVPLYMGAYFILREIFIDDIYKPLIWCKHILDVWAYIWESALYLASHGARVSAYEMSRQLYTLALLNTQNNDLISLYYWAVVSNNTAGVSAESIHIYDNWGFVRPASGGTIPTYNILDILSGDAFDGIKIDIEWAEYEIVPVILDAWLFTFTRWIIEFHDIKNTNNNRMICLFLEFLENSWYIWTWWDNYWCNVSLADIKQAKNNIVNIYFEK